MIQPREPLEQLATPPIHYTKNLKFKRPEQIKIYDDTLRDGEQMPGVAFSPETKYELAKRLSDLGVHVIDMGFPAVAATERKALQLIMQGKRRGELREDLEVIVMCRSNPKDIDVTIEALEAIRIAPKEVTFFIFTSGSDLHLKYKIGKTLLKVMGRDEKEWFDLPVEFYREANIKMSTEAIAHALNRGVTRTEFGGEDGSRCDVNYIIALAKACYDAGGTRFSFPDTVGCFTPQGVDYYIPKIVSAFPTKEFVVHFHNDFGLATINTITALAHGATHATVSVNAIGERSGNAPLHQVVAALRYLYGIDLPGFKYHKLRELRRFMEKISGVPISPQEPIIGENFFVHESGIHTAGILIHPYIYQVVPPEELGERIQFVYGKHSGAASVQAAFETHKDVLKANGIEITPQLVNETLEDIKQIREEKAETEDHSAFMREVYDQYYNLGFTEEALIRHVLRKAAKAGAR